MAKRDVAPIGAPCWIDLLSSDVEGSRAFYGELFGWEAGEPSEAFGGYFMFTKDGVPIGGGMPRRADIDAPDAWSVYLAAADARSVTEAAASNDGRIIMPAMDVADLGAMAIVSDPGGAAIGIWQPDHFPGFGVLGEVGTPIWFELLTREYDAAIRFYAEVFGCDAQVMSDTDELHYTTFDDAGTPLAGVMDGASFLPEGVPSHWSVYFCVEDADASSAKIVALGGSILRSAQDTPYGRLATVSDTTGAQFNLMAGNSSMPIEG